MARVTLSLPPSPRSCPVSGAMVSSNSDLLFEMDDHLQLERAESANLHLQEWETEKVEPEAVTVF